MQLTYCRCLRVKKIKTEEENTNRNEKSIHYNVAFVPVRDVGIECLFVHAG